MSETTVRGFQLLAGVLDETLGSCSEELLGSILDSQKELLDECDQRLQNSYFEDREPLSAREALRALIFGNLLEEQVLEGASALEAVIKEVAQPLEDSSDSHSLWNNQDFWLDDFETIFGLLGLETLATFWQRFTFPLTPRATHPDWPIWTLLDADALSRCYNEFSGLNIADAVSQLSPELFTSKNDEEDAETLQSIMSENIYALQDWIDVCHKHNTQLLILFDGDS